MKIRRGEVFLAGIPLKLTVRHALAARGVTENLFVRLVDDSGLEGWGEGVPRSYVTGETPSCSFDILADSLLPQVVGRRIDAPEVAEEILPWQDHPPLGAQSACCALELALLDLAGKRFGRSAADWFGGIGRKKIVYGGVVPLLESGDLKPFLSRLKNFELRHVKVKARGGECLEVLAEARRILGEETVLSVDANGGWDLDTASVLAGKMEPLGVEWIEQPLPRGREEEVSVLAGRTSIPLMADESLLSAADALRLIEMKGYRLFNLRLSKLGGMKSSRRVASLAFEAGLRMQVGCQVGETAILAAAGRLFASTLPGIERAEGSYGERLLTVDLCAEPFEFGRGGEAVVGDGDGLGIEVLKSRLDPLVLQSTSRE